MAAQDRILLVKLDHIGDFALTIPCLISIIHEYGGSRVGLLTNTANLQWKSLLPPVAFWAGVDCPAFGRSQSSLSAKISFLFAIIKTGLLVRSFAPSIAVDLRMQPNDWRGKLFCWLSGAGQRFGGPGSGEKLLTQVCREEAAHESELIARRLSTALATPLAEAAPPWLKLVNPHREDLIALHPGAGFPSKQWPVAHWKKLIDLLSGSNPSAKIILLGSPRERASLEEISSGTTACVEVTSSLPELVHLLARSRLLVALDSAAAHIARLTQTPCLTLFAGTSLPERWKALGDNIVLTHPVPCSPCGKSLCDVPGHPCMTLLTPESVAAAATRQAASGSARL